jgi:hypothetical protein
MSVEVISRPIGHKLGTSDIDAVIVTSAGDALVYTGSAHGLSDGDYVYIQSNFDAYNGFKYVDSISYDTFKIKESQNGDYVPFKQNADITFRISELEHGFQSVHLPIVYELHSTKWPINEADEEYSPNLIDSFEDYNGYVKLNLHRALTNPVALEYIQIISPVEGIPIEGPHQIIQVLFDWAIVINVAWDSDYSSYSGFRVDKYYNNYFVSVDVYGGLISSHPWYSEKPIQLITTLKLFPDSEGLVKFSISDELKGYIFTNNNLTLDTLPNNIDFVCQFYIKYRENYDISNGTEVTSFAGSTSNDSANFTGHAINSMMPFKSTNIGHMSDYIASDVTLARWLNIMDRPIAVTGMFFDISFINQFAGKDVQIVIFKSLQGTVLDTDTIDINNPGQGVIRVCFTPEVGYDQYCIQAKNIDQDITEQIYIDIVTDCGTFINDNLRLLEAGPFRELE